MNQIKQLKTYSLYNFLCPFEKKIKKKIKKIMSKGTIFILVILSLLVLSCAKKNLRESHEEKINILRKTLPLLDEDNFGLPKRVNLIQHVAIQISDCQTLMNIGSSSSYPYNGNYILTNDIVNYSQKKKIPHFRKETFILEKNFIHFFFLRSLF